MANEIRVNFQLNVDKGNFSDSFSLNSALYNQTGTGGGNPGTVSIGTTEETVAFSELGTEGWLVMRNLDPTNYVQWGFATTAYGGRISPGGFAVFEMEPSVTLYMKANSAACLVQIKGYEK
jgi:hypothetical protein